MIYIINFIWQLVVFILGDIISYTFILRPSFRGYNNCKYYKNKYGIIKSNYNGDTRTKIWRIGKYNALFGVGEEW